MILQYKLTRDVPALDARSGDIIVIACESRTIEVARDVTRYPDAWATVAELIPDSPPVHAPIPAHAAVALVRALDPRRGLRAEPARPPARARKPRLRVAKGA